MLKSFAKKIIAALPLSLIERSLLARFGYVVLSYSQHGEDAILKDLFTGTRKGFYVDVGAHHPHRLSNTFWFYRQGWNGINIDATPGSMKSFKKLRPRDINIEAAISEKPTTLKFYPFTKPAFNTFSESLAKEHEMNGSIPLAAQTISTTRLENVLRSHIKPGQKIDFLTIDVEGLELEVLRSMDWSTFIPDVVVVEDIHSDPELPRSSLVFTFLKEKGYHLMAYTGKTFIFDRRSHTAGSADNTHENSSSLSHIQ
ncbi:MAG: FkbM family methyltransferase [Patescibacteria group bacterium]